MLGQQLEQYLANFVTSAKALLAEPDSGGIPSAVTQIKAKGRWYLDKENFELEKRAEQKRVARIRRPKITAEQMHEQAEMTELSNDAMLKSSEDRMDTREKIIAMTVNKFWDNLVTIFNSVPRVVLETALQCMSYFQHITPRK